MAHLPEALVQYDSLRAAPEIARPRDISPSLFTRWFEYAQTICAHKGFTALAFTQLPDHILHDLGFTDTPPSVIFIAGTDAHPVDTLMVNPRAAVSAAGILRLEGCGSVDQGQVRYVTKMPRHGVVSYWGYSAGQRMLEPRQRDIRDPLTDDSVHEIEHLDGKTQLSNKMYSPFVIPILEQLKRSYGDTGPRFLEQLTQGLPILLGHQTSEALEYYSAAGVRLNRQPLSVPLVVHSPVSRIVQTNS